MFDDVETLRSFYHTKRGRSVQSLLGGYVDPFWDYRLDARNAVVGYGVSFMPRAANGIVFLPMKRGSVGPLSRPVVRASVIDSHHFPLQDVQLDRLLLVHGLEFDESPTQLLSEAWRCLDGGGRLMAIVPHRLGLWARTETSPFGHGHPFSGRQLRQLLQNSGFEVTKLYRALFVPPFAMGLPLNIHNTIETIGKRWVKPAGGVLVAEANKLLYAPAGNTSKLRTKEGLKSPRLVPQSGRAFHSMETR